MLPVRDSSSFLEELGAARVLSEAETESCAVDGIRPSAAIVAVSTDDLVRIVGLCDRFGLSIVPRGNGTHVHVGNRPHRYDVALITTGMGCVLQHNAADMTVSVQAGLTLDELNRALAESDQWLPIDPPRSSAVTVGGLIAADLNGGLRLSQGKVRDYVLGLRAVVGGGTLIRGGGQVVKNVAGYDLPKLMIGSFGTLGVVAEATLKVRPRPAADIAAAAPLVTVAEAYEHAREILQGPFAPFALDVLNPAAAAAVGLPSQAYLVVRLGGERAEVNAQLDHLAAPGVEQLDEAVRHAMRDFQIDGPGAVSCRVTLPPSALGALAEPIESEARHFGFEPLTQAHAGSGVLRLRLRVEDGTAAALPAFVGWLRFAVRQRRGSVVVEQIPAELAERVDTWGSIPAVEIMRRVKLALDEKSTFSPGRFVGGI